MVRFLAAALLLASAATPAFACDWNKAASTTGTPQSSTVATQPPAGTTPAAPATPNQPNVYVPT